MKIINLTQHTATEEQKAEGVFDLHGEDHDMLVQLLNFDELPKALNVYDRANDIAVLAKKYNPDYAMIGCVQFLDSPLRAVLHNKDILPIYSFSVRKSIEEIIDGHVIKRSIFKHIGFFNPRS